MADDDGNVIAQLMVDLAHYGSVLQGTVVLVERADEVDLSGNHSGWSAERRYLP